jgi:hypothetical protein
MRSSVRHVSGSLPGLALLLFAGPVHADDGAIRVTVQSIHAIQGAADKPGGAPAAMVKKLKKVFPGYGAFKVLDEKALDLTAPGKSATTKLPSEHELSLTFLGRKGRFLRLRLAIPPRIKTDVRVNDGGTFYQAGMKHEGGILVLAVKAATAR